MAACHIPVNSGSYGVGIRIAFYLQWFGMIVTAWALESGTLNLKFINALTTAATSIGLVLNLERLQPVEIYIVLLLTCGALYFTVPIYLWRLVTCCRPWWDPDRWARIKTGWLFRVLTYSMYGALLGLHIWFWSRGVHERRKTDPKSDTDTECEQFGFLFTQVRLDDPGLVTLNIIIHLTILLIGTGVSASRIGIFEVCYWDRSQKRRRWRITKNRILSLRQFRGICDLIVASIITLAVELVISWNRIAGANELDSAAQLIPPFITGAFLVHGLCVWAGGPDSDSEASDSYYCPGATIHNGSGPSRTRTSGRRRRPAYRRRRSPRASRGSSDLLDEYPDVFDLSGVLPTPPASLGGYDYPYASAYYDIAPDFYGMQDGHYVNVETTGDGLGHRPPQPPSAAAGAAASSRGGSRGASVIAEEGFIRL